ncbi:MAG: hypothetical protein JWP35_389 [Caulobacter sp.]|nr:hypothetical protein [Caulobacter sp.]
MRRAAARAAWLVAAALLACSPATAGEKVFSGVSPVNALKTWTANLWQVWAEPNGDCLALIQYPDETPFRFWGFRQSPGSRVELIFGAIASARPQTVQMSFNDGGNFDYAARVEQYADWDAYVISLQPDALSVFPEDIFIDADVDGEQVFWGGTHRMRSGEEAMAKCLAWQQKH